MLPENNPFFEKPKAKPIKLSSVVFTVLTIVSITLLISWFTILGQNQVDGPSMQPNFATDEFLLINRIPSLTGAQYQRGETIVYQKPGFPEFIKRVIALPGESVAIKNCYIYVNGKKLKEYYLPTGLCTNAGSFIQEGAEPIVVPSNHYFTVGDNRPQSLDGRNIELGFTKREWIKGSVFLRIWPLDKLSIIEIGKTEFLD